MLTVGGGPLELELEVEVEPELVLEVELALEHAPSTRDATEAT
jgi:hypothetical protein